jgi:hypothetical protein
LPVFLFAARIAVGGFGILILRTLSFIIFMELLFNDLGIRDEDESQQESRRYAAYLKNDCPQNEGRDSKATPRAKRT